MKWIRNIFRTKKQKEKELEQEILELLYEGNKIEIIGWFYRKLFTNQIRIVKNISPKNIKIGEVTVVFIKNEMFCHYPSKNIDGLDIRTYKIPEENYPTSILTRLGNLHSKLCRESINGGLQ